MGVPLAWLLRDIKGDVLLIDMDTASGRYCDAIDSYSGTVVLYPHGAAPILSWDGIHEPHEKVSMNLVTSEGHKEVMRRYGYPVPIEVIGWYLCKLEDWRSGGERVLFCPIHPIMHGSFMYTEDFNENNRVYRELLDMNIDLSIRHKFPLDMNGLFEVAGVKAYSTSGFDDLDDYDLVIANGTLAYVAVAKGIPTVMIKQETCTREPAGLAKSVDKYWDYLKYPFDTIDLEAGMKAASETEPVEWRNRFIGEQMIGEEFCQLIQNLS